MKQNVINSKATHVLMATMMLSGIGVSIANSTFSSTVAHADNPDSGKSYTGGAIYKTGSMGVVLEANGNGGDGKEYYQYCMNAALPSPLNDTKYNAGSYDMDQAANIAGLGPTYQGDTPLYHFQTSTPEGQEAAVQIAIWIALGQSADIHNYGDAGVNTPFSKLGPFDLSKTDPAFQADVNGLLKQSDNGHNNLNSGYFNAADQDKNFDALKQSAQAAVNQQAQDEIAKWATGDAGGSAGLAAAAKADAQLDSLKNEVTPEKVNALVHFDQVDTPTSKEDAAKLPHYNDGDKEKHSDSVALGAHVFEFNNYHDDASKLGDEQHISNVQFGNGSKVHFDKPLPKDTVITNNGSTVTSDASASQDYDLSYGKVEVQIPFSDIPAHSDDNLNAQATVTGHIQTDSQTANLSSEATVNSNVSTSGFDGIAYMNYQITDGVSHQSYKMIIKKGPKIAPKSATVTGTASSEISRTVSRDSDFSATPSANLSMGWDSMLTSFNIHKTDEHGSVLKGVTFEMVQSSVVNSDVLKASYPLATEDGQLISLPKVTNDKGDITWGNLPFGKYELLEIQNDNKHVLNSTPIDLTADRYHVDEQLEHIVNKTNGKIDVSSHSSNTPTPAIHTEATGENGSKLILGAGTQGITDTVHYENLKQNTTYHMVGQFMDAETGKAIDGLHGEQTFKTTDQTTGDVKVNFSGDASKFAGKKIVAYETMYGDNSGKANVSDVVATHSDIHDSGQTVQVTKPEIHTNATVDGQKTISPNGQVTVKDTVTYSGLVPGQKMSMNGHMVNKDNNQSISDTASQTFTPTNTDGTVDVNIKTDASKMGQKGMVAYESAKDSKGQVIATHEDINDTGQSIARTPQPVGQANVPTAKPSLASTATQPGNIAIMVGIVGFTAGITAAGVGLKKRKSEAK